VMTVHPCRESVCRERDRRRCTHGSRRSQGRVRGGGNVGLVFHPSVVPVLE
jgi:hypothetical protein